MTSSGPLHPDPRHYSTLETYLAACQRIKEWLAKEKDRRSKLSSFARLREDLRDLGSLRTITIEAPPAPPPEVASPPPRYTSPYRAGMEAKWR